MTWPFSSSATASSPSLWRSLMHGVVAVFSMGALLALVAVLEVAHPVPALGRLLFLVLGVNLAGWAYSALRCTDRIFDAVGTGSFILLSLVSLRHAASWSLASSLFHRQLLATSLVLVWAFRLGKFLVQRITEKGKDSRFDAIKHDPSLFLVVWIGQAAWVFLVGLPIYLLNCYDVSNVKFLPVSARVLGTTEIIGLAVWIAGMYIESRADAEKKAFRQGGGGPGARPWIETGLWSYSRHPNYLGELMVWIGQCAMIAPFFWHAGSYLLALVCLLSPLFTYLSLRFMSGVPIEESADRKWGSRADYRAYKERVPRFFPKLRAARGVAEKIEEVAQEAESEIKTALKAD